MAEPEPAASIPDAPSIENIILSDADIRERCTRLSTEFSSDMVRYGLGHLIPVLASVRTRDQFERVVVGLFDQTIRMNAGDWRVEGVAALKADRERVMAHCGKDTRVLLYAHHSHIAESASLNRALHAADISLAYNLAGINLAADLASKTAFELLQMVGQPRVAGPHEMLEALGRIGALADAGMNITTASTPGLIRKGDNRTDARIVKALKKAVGAPTYTALVETVNMHGVATNYGVAPGWLYRAERDATGQKPLGFDKLMVIASLKEKYESMIQVIGPRLVGPFANAQAVAAALDETIQGAHPILPEDFAAFATLLGYSALHEGRVHGFSDKSLQRVENEVKRLTDFPTISQAAMHMRTNQVDAWLRHNRDAKKESHNLELIAEAAQRYL